ncbi:MAG: hypothetical protein Ct9H90mP6_09930 [Gammaproteobacteria bacterium]|nr:MAG: hypothetical protein Ct9H90mP6_09930 [Gammaproteobacteria bacterium]
MNRPQKNSSKPRAEIVSISVVGDDPVFMLRPIPASKKALEAANLSIDDIDLYEVMKHLLLFLLHGQLSTC